MSTNFLSSFSLSRFISLLSSGNGYDQMILTALMKCFVNGLQTAKPADLLVCAGDEGLGRNERRGLDNFRLVNLVESRCYKQ